MAINSPGGKPGNGAPSAATETVLGRLEHVRRCGDGWEARCPAHADARASLTVGVGEGGRVLLRCHAGCDTAAVVRALGLEMRDLFPSDGGRHGANGKSIVAAYDYLDEAGRRLFQAVRFEPKDFKQRRPRVVNARNDRPDDWVWSLKGVQPVLYRLPELLAAPPDQLVFVAEGEKDVEALRKLGLVATTNPMGAGKWRAAYNGALRGRPVVILPDNDDAGRTHTEQVARALLGTAASVKVLALPALPDKGDVSDWLKAGGTREELERLAAECPEWHAATDQAGFEGGSEPWEPPAPLGTGYAVPPFPVDCLPPRLASWVRAEAEATQTPPDLAALLALAICGAGLAGKFRVLIRSGWPEPLNLFVVVALPPGDRKSAVFADAIAPVQSFEREEEDRMAPIIAELATEHRLLEKRLKAVEDKAAKAKPAELQGLREEARDLAKQLASHEVPQPPRLYCDDETPESLAKLLAEQGGRMLQASAEGTAFEIVKGRYSEKGRPNFDVYLKGHSGDSLRVGRVSRGRDTVDRPALSLALAVQPDVIRGLAEHACMRGRGFLARPFYSLPESKVGRRKTKPPPAPKEAVDGYQDTVLALWRLSGATDEKGRPGAHWLEFSPEAERLLEDFERWLEPQLAPGEELSQLAGWANKLAGAVARVAGVLHMAATAGVAEPWNVPVGEAAAAAAIRLGRDYLLPHALAAFGLMGADERLEDAKAVAAWLGKQVSERSEESERGVVTVSRRDIHQAFRGRFKTVEDVDPVIRLLVDEGYLRPAPLEKREGPGRGPSPRYEVNPLLGDSYESGGDSQKTQNARNGSPMADSAHSEESEAPHQPGCAGTRKRGTL
jgi:hypothetical protein